MSASPMPDPQAPVQDMSQDVPDQIQAPPDQAPAPDAAPAAPAAPAIPPQPKSGMFHSILTGALQGLAMGGIPGAIHGGIDPNAAHVAFQQRKDEAKTQLAAAQSAVKFQDAQSAEMVAQAHFHDARTSQLPAELQLKSQAQDAETAKSLMAMGFMPSVVSDNSGAGASAGLAQLTKANGAVPPMAILHLGNNIVGFDLNQMAQSAAPLQTINKIGAIIGRPDVVPGVWAKLPPAAKVKLLNDTAHFFNPTPATAEKADGQIEEYKNYLAAANMQPDSADKQDNVDKLKSAISYLQQSKQNTVKTKTDLATAPRVAGQNARVVPVLDENNKLSYMHAGDAVANGASPAPQGVKALQAGAQFADIDSATAKVSSSIDALPENPFTPAQIARLTLATQTSDRTVLKNIVSAFSTEGLNPAQRDFVNWTTQLNERALSLRGIAGMGQGAQDLREAIRATLPSLRSGDKDMMHRQLEAFTNQVDQLRKSVPGIASTPKSGGVIPKANSPAPQGRPVTVGGKVVGYTLDGKTMTPAQ